MAEDLTPTVEPLLAKSQAAHLVYRDAVTRHDQGTATAALQEAYDARTAAQAADPSFTAASWKSREGLYPHVALLHFYREELAK